MKVLFWNECKSKNGKEKLLRKVYDKATTWKEGNRMPDELNREHREEMVVCLKYIDQHLREPLVLEKISKYSGYSKFYFERLFKQYTGLSVMEYVKKRRLIWASEEILAGKRIIDVAMEYAYESHSGFTKAFTKVFGFSPALLKGLKYQMELLEGENAMTHAFLETTSLHEKKERLFEYLMHRAEDSDLTYDKERLGQAYLFADKAYAGQYRYSGDEYVTHPLNVGILLVELEADEEVVISGIMCDILSRTDIQPEQIENTFSKRVRQILENVRDECWKINESVQMQDALLVKLAERLHNMRTIEFMEEKEKRKKASETLKLFVPLAVKLNNEKLTAELNDLSLRYV